MYDKLAKKLNDSRYQHHLSKLQFCFATKINMLQSFLFAPHFRSIYIYQSLQLTKMAERKDFNETIYKCFYVNNGIKLLFLYFSLQSISRIQRKAKKHKMKENILFWVCNYRVFLDMQTNMS